MTYSQESLQLAFSANGANGIRPTLHRAFITIADAMESEREELRDESIENEVNDLLYEDQMADLKTAYKPWMQ